MRYFAAVLGLAALTLAQTTSDEVTGTNTDTPTPTLESAAALAPSVTPNLVATNVPNAQEVCPGYKASNVVVHDASITADLTLAGEACNAYGNDIVDLTLEVQYQNATRLNVKIYPKYIVPSNRSLYILDDSLSPSGKIELGGTAKTSDLLFEWDNEPSFQFRVKRAGSGEPIFDTYGTKLVFEDQFLEVVTSMDEDYNIYGLPEAIRGTFRLSNNNYSQTFWNQYNEMNDQPIDANMHSTHPVYLETRYSEGSSKSHIVYGRNLHGQEWILRPDSLIYRTIGGSIDFYFFSGPTPTEALAQQQLGVIQTPAMPPYWALGFFQVRWGYQNWTVLQEILDGYRNANIPLEAIMNDLDPYLQYRIFTHDNNTYPVPEGQEFLAQLHAAGQYWLPILDPNVYVPDPINATDANPPYNRGDELGLYIRRGQGSEDYYIGDQWPGFSVWPDFLLDASHDFWADEMVSYYEQLEFDGWWLDISDLSSWCTGSCGSGRLEDNPIHVPFPLPRDPGTIAEVNYEYPEDFDVTNATEAASASAASVSQSLAYPTPTTTTGTPVVGFTFPTPGVRNITFPPYALNLTLPGHALEKEVVAPYATHNDEFNTTEYELHNTYGYVSTIATYNGLLKVKPGKRPFLISRSTSPGSGNYTGHWGGDTNSRWGNMYMTIPQALTFSIAGIPYFGVETCGFNGNTDMELCTRWMQLSAFFPIYRNHNSRNTIPQEAYRWATTAESTRRVIYVRFQLLPYQYTLFWKAHTEGGTVLRPLAWNFPDDESLKDIDNQFMLGPSILITPVLAPLLRESQGVFPSIGAGTRWYDWYTLNEVHAQPGQNVTLDAPLEHIPVHVRGGTVIAYQTPSNTTKHMRQNPWTIIVALDSNNTATGELFLDDGITLDPQDTKVVNFQFSDNVLSIVVEGNYDGQATPLEMIEIAGWRGKPVQSISIGSGGNEPEKYQGAKCRSEDGKINVDGLRDATQDGAFAKNLKIKFS